MASTVIPQTTPCPLSFFQHSSFILPPARDRLALILLALLFQENSMIALSPPLLFPYCNNEPIKILLLELLYIASSEPIHQYPHKFNFKFFSSKKKRNHRRFGIYLYKFHARGEGELAEMQTKPKSFSLLDKKNQENWVGHRNPDRLLSLSSGFSPANLTVEGCLCWLCTILFPTCSLPSHFLTAYLQPPLSFSPYSSTNPLSHSCIHFTPPCSTGLQVFIPPKGRQDPHKYERIETNA